MPGADEQRWMEQWRHAAVELERIRREELRAMTDDDVRATMVSLAGLAACTPDRAAGTGLVEQQRLFMLARMTPLLAAAMEVNGSALRTTGVTASSVAWPCSVGASRGLPRTWTSRSSPASALSRSSLRYSCGTSTPGYRTLRRSPYAARVVPARASNGVPVDLALGGFPFEERAVERATDFTVTDDVRLRTCSAEDLVVFKAFAGRD